MHTKPKQTQPPLGDIVAVSELKAHLNIRHDDHDLTLEGYINSAVSYLDGPGGALGRCMIDQEWEVKFTEFPSDDLSLPMLDVSAAVVTYLDASGAAQVLPESDYQLYEDDMGSVIAFSEDFSAPETSNMKYPVTVSMVTGYGAVDKVPPAFKTMIMLMASQWFLNKAALAEVESQIPMNVDALIENFRTQRT